MRTLKFLGVWIAMIFMVLFFPVFVLFKYSIEFTITGKDYRE